MISFREIGYWGRLGNQMFQFASTLGIARKIGTAAVFPLENCFIEQKTGPFISSTGENMNVKCDLLDCFKIPENFFIPIRHIRADQIYREPDFTFDPLSFNIPDFTAVQGYLQSEKYFKFSENEIREIFSFKDDVAEKSKLYLDSIAEGNKKIVSVHIRRGDYLQSPDHHPPCHIGYYEAAFAEIKKGGDYIFLIFSDDIEWCKDNFKSPEFRFCDLGHPYQDLCLMSFCDSHIIANSSFSWWGAWLNPKPDKKIIAPKKWFGPLLNKNVNDLYCENWIKI